LQTFLDGSIGARFGTPFWDDDGRVISWASVFANTGADVSSATILLLGVAVKFDLTGRYWEDWEAVGWYTGGEFYASDKEFRAAINSTDFVKPPPFATVEGD
jgi:primary-amine oxidase